MSYLEQLSDWVESQSRAAAHREMEEYYTPWFDSYRLVCFRLKNWECPETQQTSDSLNTATEWDQLRAEIEWLDSEFDPFYCDLYSVSYLWDMYGEERLRWGVRQFGVVRESGEIAYCIRRD